MIFLYKINTLIILSIFCNKCEINNMCLSLDKEEVD